MTPEQCEHSGEAGPGKVPRETEGEVGLAYRLRSHNPILTQLAFCFDGAVDVVFKKLVLFLSRYTLHSYPS